MGSSAAVAARRRLRIWTILLASGLAFLAPSAIAPGLPALQADFAHIDNAELMSRLVLTTPMLFIALAGPFVGLAVDRFGRRNVVILSTAFYGVAGVAGLVAGSIETLLVSRAFLGVFLAGILTGLTALIGDYFEGEERNRIAGLQGAFIAFATLSFVVAAGLLAEIHWRAGFLLFAVAFVFVPMMLLSLYEPSGGGGPAGAAPDPPPTARQWAAIGRFCALAFFTMILLFMIPSQTAFFLVEIGVGDPTNVGLAIGTFNLSSGLASLAYARLRARLGSGAIFALVYVSAGAGYVLTGLSDSLADTLVAMAIGGLSMGVFLPNANLAIISRTSMGVRGRALGALTTMFFLGQFASPFYSVPVAGEIGVGAAFVASGFVLLAMGAGFALGALLRRGGAPPG